MVEGSEGIGSYGHAVVLYNLGSTLHLAGETNEGIERLESAEKILNRQESAEEMRERVNFELALARLSTPQKNKILTELKEKLSRILQRLDICKYQSVGFLRRLSEVFRAHSLYEEAKKAIQGVSLSTCKDFPEFFIDSYEVEALLVKALLTNNSDSTDLRMKLENLSKNLIIMAKFFLGLISN